MSFWTRQICGIWFRRVRCIGSWPNIAAGCSRRDVADLFGSGRGRRSVPGSVIAVVMVLQALEGLSDREAIQSLRRDIAWKAAAGLSLTHGGFHPTVLTLWRARLRRSESPERIFDAVRQVIEGCGVLAGKDRRALDSTILDDAVATQDTVTMISSQIRRCRRLIPAAADLRLVAHDYDSKTKPSCDWSDPESRSELINGLVSDALAVISAVEDANLSGEQADAVGLLGVVAGQDVEADPDREGRWRIARRVAKNRTISTADPESRHGHKTRAHKRDGYKAHVAAEPETGLVTAAKINPRQHPRRGGGRRPRRRPGPRQRGRRRLRVRVRSRPRNLRPEQPHTSHQTHRAQTPHRRRLPPRRLRHRHQSQNRDLSHRAHRPHTPRRYRPLRQAMQRLPQTGPVHHRQERAHHRSRQIPRPTSRQQDPLGRRRNPHHLPPIPAARRADHRLAHTRQSPTRPIPRNQTQPDLVHHQNSSHQPTTAHQPRRRPHHQRLGAHHHLNQNQPPPDRPEPREHPQKTGHHPQNHPQGTPNQHTHQPPPPTTHQHSHPTHPLNQHPPSVLIPGFVIDTRNVPTIPPGRPWGDREREKHRTRPLRRAHPQPPPPQIPNASRHPPQRVGSDNMIPAPIRSVPQTDRWCLQLLTSMQRDCDTVIPLVAARSVPAGCCGRAGVPIMERRRSQNTANQRLRTLGGCLRTNLAGFAVRQTTWSESCGLGSEPLCTGLFSTLLDRIDDHHVQTAPLTLMRG